MRAIFYSLAFGLVACLPACADRASQSSRPADATVPSDSSQSAVADAKIHVSVKDQQEVRELIKSHSGKVVVLDLWALW
jgi:hypothetical protein